MKMSDIFSENDLEILIATKDRCNFDFLLKMFPFKHFSNFNLLIVNQSKTGILLSEYNSVRVINSNESGLSKSRNIAIKNAVKKICLISDDDVVFSDTLEKSVLDAFMLYQEASIITFNHIRVGNSYPEKKLNKKFEHNFKSIWNVSSIEIAFKVDDIRKNEIYFDENFGLSSFFETAEEFLFLRSSLIQKIKVIYSPEIIVSHPQVSSGKDAGADNLIFARGALYYKVKGNFAYLWLLKYMLFLISNNYINKADFIKKYKKGLAGIYKYKELTNA